MHEAGEDVSVLDAVVIMWTIHIGRNHRCELTSMLLVICSEENTYVELHHLYVVDG